MSHSVISSACVLGLFFFSTLQAAPAATTGAGATVGAGAGAGDALAMDACALLRGSEISAVIGAPVSEPAREDAGMQPDGSYSSSCVWEIKVPKPTAPKADAPLGGKSFVIVHAMQWPRGSGLAHTFLDQFWVAAASGDIPNSPVRRKFGDDALWWGDGLAVRRYDVSFGVSVFFPGAKGNRTGAFEERLAPEILRRIDKREDEFKRQHPES